MNWILLILAGCLELVFTFCLGKINRVVGAEKYMWSFGLLISLCVSMLLLIRVTKALPVGTAYAIWTGIGAAGTVLIFALVYGLIYLMTAKSYYHIVERR